MDQQKDNNSLYHWKYIKRIRKGNRWVYFYDVETAKKDAAASVKKVANTLMKANTTVKSTINKVTNDVADKAKSLAEEAKKAAEKAKAAIEAKAAADKAAKEAAEKAKKAAEEAKKAKEEAKRADEEAKKAIEEAKRAEEEAKRAEETSNKKDENTNESNSKDTTSSNKKEENSAVGASDLKSIIEASKDLSDDEKEERVYEYMESLSKRFYDETDGEFNADNVQYKLDICMEYIRAFDEYRGTQFYQTGSGKEGRSKLDGTYKTAVWAYNTFVRYMREHNIANG